MAEVRKGDGADLRHLVRMLDAKEASTRLLAIEALERLTGERLGYDYAASVADRREAVERWRVWVEARGPGGGGGVTGTENGG